MKPLAPFRQGYCVDGSFDHPWQPISFVFESQLLDRDGRVQVRMPDVKKGRVYCVCMRCHQHTYIETGWANFYVDDPWASEAAQTDSEEVVAAKERVVVAASLGYSAQTEDPREALRRAMSFAVDDWGSSRAMAWVWGIVNGWEDDAMAELAAEYSWDAETIARVRRLHRAFDAEAGLGAAMAEASALIAPFGHRGPWLRTWEPEGDRAWVAHLFDVLVGEPARLEPHEPLGTYIEGYGPTPEAAVRSFTSIAREAIVGGTMLTRDAVIARARGRAK